MAKKFLDFGTLPANEEMINDMRTYHVSSLWREELSNKLMSYTNHDAASKIKFLVSLGDDDYIVHVSFDDNELDVKKAAVWLLDNAPRNFSDRRKIRFEQLKEDYSSL